MIYHAQCSIKISFIFDKRENKKIIMRDHKENINLNDNPIRAIFYTNQYLTI